MADELVRAVANKAKLRFVVVHNPTTVRTIADQHGVDGALFVPLGNAISSAQLLATQLKGPGAVSVMIENDGAVSYIAADSNPFGLSRAMIPPRVIEAASAIDPTKELIGKGTLMVEKRISGAKQGYRGVVELASSSIARCVAFYLDRSEQIPSCIGLSTRFDGRGLRASGGFMIQAFPDTEASTIDRMEATVRELPPMDELFADDADGDSVLERLGAGFKIEVVSRSEPRPFCPCSRERSARAASAIGRAELQGFVDRAEDLELRCDFCRKLYRFTVAELSAMLAG